MHSLDQVEVGNGGCQQNEDEVGCTPGIEDHRGQQQHEIAPFGRHKEIDGQKERQETEQEYVAAEYHEAFRRLWVGKEGDSFILQFLDFFGSLILNPFDLLTL